MVQFGSGLPYSNIIWRISSDTGLLDTRNRVYSSYRPDPVYESHYEVIPTTGQMLVFGGTRARSTGQLAQNWTRLVDLESGRWETVSSSGPHYMDYTSMAFDEKHGMMVLFGGYYHDGSTVYSDETWLFNVTSEEWMMVNTTLSPTGRYGHAMAWDGINDRVILHGGYVSGHYAMDDTWAYNFESNTWEELATGPPLYGHSGDFDPVNGEFVIWGGVGRNGYDDSIWKYDVVEDEWSEFNPTFTPYRRAWPIMAYDHSEEVFLMRGGYYYGMDPYVLTDTWRLVPDANEKNGIYTSAPIGTDGDTAAWDSISWSCDVDEHTSVKLQIAVYGDGYSGIFVGPDGTPDTYFTESSGEPIDAGTVAEYLRYRLYLESDHAGRSPVVHGVTLSVRPLMAPTVQLLSPNGGEDLIEGGSHIITWTSSEVADPGMVANPITLDYSLDGGTTWTAIADLPNTGFYNWSVPAVETATGLVRVSAIGSDGSTVMDASDMTFAIDPPANWQLPGSGSGDGTGDGSGDGDQTGSPDRTTSSEDRVEVGTLWIVVAAEGVAIATLTILLIAMIVRRSKGIRRS